MSLLLLRLIEGIRGNFFGGIIFAEVVLLNEKTMRHFGAHRFVVRGTGFLVFLFAGFVGFVAFVVVFFGASTFFGEFGEFFAGGGLSAVLVFFVDGLGFFGGDGPGFVFVAVADEGHEGSHFFGVESAVRLFEGGFESGHDSDIFGVLFFDAFEEGEAKGFGAAESDFGSGEGGSHFSSGAEVEALSVRAMAGEADGGGGLAFGHDGGVRLSEEGGEGEGGEGEDGGDFHDLIGCEKS